MQANFIQKLAKEHPEKFQLHPSALKLYARFFQYIWQQKWWFLLGSSTVFGLSFLQILTPQLTRYIIDEVIPHQDLAQVPWIGAGILGIAIATGGLNFIRNYSLSQVGQQTVYGLRDQLYRHLQDLSLQFYENQRTGTLMIRLTKDVESVEKLITTDVAEIIAETFTFMVVVSYLLYVDWQLTGLLLISLPIMVLLSQQFGEWMRTIYRDIQDQSAAINNHLQETLTNAKLVKACANETYEIDRFSLYNQSHRDANLRAVSLWSIFMPVIDIMNSLGTIIVLTFGSWQVMKQQITLGEMTAFLAYLNPISQPAKRYSRVFNVLQKGATALERIFELLDTQPKVLNKPDAIVLPSLVGNIRMTNVSFSYQSHQPILHHINLEIASGMTIACVGSSGAGKSTIANLLARFYDPDSGCITIDGHDLRNLDLPTFRRQIGLVSQETLLLHGTIFDNIVYGQPHASKDQVQQAAKLAYAHDFIGQFPEGYDTIIGERGVKLSGGQRQRLAIARALIKDPQLLILDEATSSLDTESETLIQQALTHLMKHRTCFVIAHRLSTIRNADLIVVLEQGKIIEMGKHDELLDHGDRYAKLYAMQFPQKSIVTNEQQSRLNQ
ncbi:ABC transporter ATP-binding protein [Alkalinema pantanalense CENA528]|uniref:ABC transporter ATP-binding protein n=1 Tax=Alkalinema pantanalense TaxID=1620705 RepID=UPI003D6F058F